VLRLGDELPCERPAEVVLPRLPADAARVEPRIELVAGEQAARVAEVALRGLKVFVSGSLVALLQLPQRPDPGADVFLERRP